MSADLHTPPRRTHASLLTAALAVAIALIMSCSVATGTAVALDAVHPVVDDSAHSLADTTITGTARIAQDDSTNEDLDHYDPGSGPASPNPPQPITDPAYDWCRWWSFQDLASEVQHYPWLNIDSTLRSDLGRCMAERYPGDPLAWGAAAQAAGQNEGELELALSKIYPGADTTQIRLPVGTWVAWFTASAADVPPQS